MGFTHLHLNGLKTGYVRNVQSLESDTGGDLACSIHHQTLRIPARSRQIPHQTVAPSPGGTPRKVESLFRQNSVIESKIHSSI